MGRDDLEIAPRVIDGDTVYFVGDPIKHDYHRLDVLQYEIFKRLDGKTSLEAISAWLLAEHEIEAPPEALAEFIGNLRGLNLLDLPADYDDDIVRGREVAARIHAQLERDGVVYGVRGPEAKTQDQPGGRRSAEAALLEGPADLPERRRPTAQAQEERALFDQAIVHLRKGRVQACGHCLRRVLQRSPRNARARYLLHAIFAEYLGKPKDVDSIFFWRIPITNPDRWLGSLDKMVGWALFRPATLVLLSVYVAVALVALASDFERFSVDLKHFLTFRWFDDAVFFPVLFWTVGPFLIFVHEVAHGLTCRHYGGRVREMGILVAYLSATAYCDISSTYLLESRWQRALTCFAGTLWHIFAWATFVFLYHLTDSTSYVGLLSVVSVPILLLTIFGGCNPLLRTDGYFALTEILNYPNLNVDAVDYVKRRARELVLGVPQEIPDEYRPHARMFTVYVVGSTISIAAVIYGVLTNLLGYLISYLHTFGVFLALFVLWFTVGQRVVKAARVVWGMRRELWGSRRPRAVVVASAVAVVALLLTPWRVTIEGPARLRPAISVVRSPQEGRIDRVLVRDGQRVVKGETLAALETPQLDAAVLRAEADLIAAELDLAGLQAGRRSEELAIARAAVDAAADELANAARRMRLTERSRGAVGDVEAIDRERAERAAAQTRFAIATRELETLQAGPQGDEVLSASARLKSLKAQLDDARVHRARAVLTSPGDGVVSVVSGPIATDQDQSDRASDRAAVVDPDDAVEHGTDRAPAIALLVGRRVVAGEPLFEVRERGQDVLELRLPTAEPVGLIREGTVVEGRFFGMPAVAVTGQVKSIGQAVERDEEGTYVRVDVSLDPALQELALPAGLAGTARILEGRRTLIAYAWLRLVRLVEIDIAALL